MSARGGERERRRNRSTQRFIDSAGSWQVTTYTHTLARASIAYQIAEAFVIYFRSKWSERRPTLERSNFTFKVKNNQTLLSVSTGPVTRGILIELYVKLVPANEPRALPRGRLLFSGEQTAEDDQKRQIVDKLLLRSRGTPKRTKRRSECESTANLLLSAFSEFHSIYLNIRLELQH